MSRQRLMQLILEPRITEKTTFIGEKYNQFVFKVAKDATKPDIKKSIKLLFDVDVISVQISNIRGKRKVFKQRSGKRQDFKKAYVKLAPGSDIDFSGV